MSCVCSLFSRWWGKHLAARSSPTDVMSRNSEARGSGFGRRRWDQCDAFGGGLYKYDGVYPLVDIMNRINQQETVDSLTRVPSNGLAHLSTYVVLILNPSQKGAGGNHMQEGQRGLKEEMSKDTGKLSPWRQSNNLSNETSGERN